MLLVADAWWIKAVQRSYVIWRTGWSIFLFWSGGLHLRVPHTLYLIWKQISIRSVCRGGTYFSSHCIIIITIYIYIYTLLANIKGRCATLDFPRIENYRLSGDEYREHLPTPTTPLKKVIFTSTKSKDDLVLFYLIFGYKVGGLFPKCIWTYIKRLLVARMLAGSPVK